MRNWTADWGNDPDDDYNLVMEILCDEEFVGVVKQSPSGLFVKWYPHKEDLNVPVDWLLKLLIDAQERLTDST